jgi:hypothetical protein
LSSVGVNSSFGDVVKMSFARLNEFSTTSAIGITVHKVKAIRTAQIAIDRPAFLRIGLKPSRRWPHCA